MSLIYHLTTRDAALLARQTGEYRTESLAKDGFIHLSQFHQVLGVANAFYVGQKDLVILIVETSYLEAELKYEAPVHPMISNALEPVKDEDFLSGKRLSNSNDFLRADLSTDLLFPHLYGPLNFDAVVKVVDFPVLADGKFELPAEISNQK